MKESFGDNILPFKKKGAKAEKVSDEKVEMVRKLKDVILALGQTGDDSDMALRFEDFLKKIEKPDYKITKDDWGIFGTSIKIAEALLRERDPEKANNIFGISNVA